ncbi:ribonuclease H-like domain-containing protein [Tanacetum coccineum]
MAKSSSSSDNEVYDDSFCSKSCRKNTENLNNKIIKLNEELSDCETDLYNYKRGLSQVEARLVEFKENEIKLCERIRVLERDIEIRDNKIENLRNELEEVKKEKESIDFKIEKFDNASKDLDSLLGNQRLDKDKKGLGFNEYSVVPPPPAQVYSPPKKDLSWMGLPEFVDDTVTDYSRPTPSIDVSKDVSDEQKAIWKSNSASFSEQGGSVGNVVSKPMISMQKCTGHKGLGEIKGTPIIEDWIAEDESEVKKKVWVPTARTKFPTVGSKVLTAKPTDDAVKGNKGKVGIPQDNIDDKGYWDSGCSRHMTGNISYLSEYEPYNGGYVSFGHGGGKITGKGTIKTGKLEFENVYFVKELKYNLFSVSQICDNKNSVLFTNSECLVLGKDFKLVDDTHVLLRTPRQQNIRLGHLNFKTINKLVRNNLVKGLPSKSFENNHTCVACLKGKQHKASCKTNAEQSSLTKLLAYPDLSNQTSLAASSMFDKLLLVIPTLMIFQYLLFFGSDPEAFTSSIS